MIRRRQMYSLTLCASMLLIILLSSTAANADESAPARDPKQPWPDGPVIGAQLRQVTPGPDERLLHDVIRGRAVGAEPHHITMQGHGMASVELADRRIGVTWELAGGLVRDSRHVYYHG